MIYFTTLLISVSLTLIIVRSKLAEGIRSWVMKRSNPNGVTLGYLINCPQCSGVWVGLVTVVCCIPLVYHMRINEMLHFICVITFGTSLCALIADTYLFR